MERSRKEELVISLRQVFSDNNLVVVTRHNGLTVAEVSELRVRMRAAGAGFRITKNTLAREALKNTSFAYLADCFSGPTGIAFSQDPVAAAKVVVEYAKENSKLEAIAAGLDDRILDAAALKALAALPSLDELRGRLVGLLQAPASKLVRVLQTPGGQLARVLAAHAAKD